MTRISLLIAVAALTAPTAAQSASPSLPGEAPGVEQHGMQCTPRRAKRGGTIQVQLPPRHGSDFAIVAPKGELYFIAFKQPDQASTFQPLIPEQRFHDMTALTLNITDTRGIPMRKQGGQRTIFRERGTYIVVVSPALETEDPVIDGWCKIKFAR